MRALLLTITERRAKNRLRNDRAAETRRRQRPRPTRFFFRTDEDGGGFEQFASAEPTPEDVAVMRESLHEMLTVLPDDQREIALLKMQAYTNREIADRVNCSVATVERRLKQDPRGMDAARSRVISSFDDQSSHCPERASQIRIVWSSLPEAIRLPSGLNATQWT